MASPNFFDPESLATLSATVNQTLIDIGRFFQSDGSMQSRAQLKRSIPAAKGRFHLALDNLSEQIFIAKAFLERDYEAIKATKAAPQASRDVEMDEADAAKEAEVVPQPTEKVESGAQSRVKMESDTKATATIPSGNPESTQPNLAENAVKTEEQNEAAPTADQSLPTRAEDINFDYVLNEAAGGPNDFDLHLDFGNDDIGNQNFLSDSNFVGSGTGSGMDHHNETEQSGSINTLLPGLDNFNHNASGGGGDLNIDLQATENSQQAGQQHDAQTGHNAEEVIAPGESSFDDLFMETDNLVGDGIGDQDLLGGDGLMNISELDDNWFT